MYNKNTRIRMLVMSIIVIGLLLVPSFAFAAVNTPSTITTYFIRTSGNEAEAYLYVTFGGQRTKVVTKVELLESPEGTDNFTVVEGPFTRTKYNTTYASRLVNFELDTGYDYRVRFTITDSVGSAESTVVSTVDLQDAVD